MAPTLDSRTAEPAAADGLVTPKRGGRDPWRRRSVPVRRAPWVRSALALAVGIFLGGSWPRLLSDTVACGLTAAAALTGILRWARPAVEPARERASSTIAVRCVWWLVPFVVGLTLPTEPHEVTLPPGPHRLTVEIVGAPRARPPRHPGRTSSLVMNAELRRLDGQPASGRVRLAVPERPLGRGDVLTLRVWIRPGSKTIGVRHPSHLAVRSIGRWSGLDRLRLEQRRRWRDRFSPDVHPWLQALILGERGDLGPTVTSRFRDVGQSHLLAISGLHLGLLAAMMTITLSRWSPFGSHARSALVVVLLVIYAGFAGADSSVVRATLLGGLAALAALRGRRSPAANALAISFIALVLFDPAAAGRLGFALTFGAVAGILLLGRARRRLPSLVADHGARGSRLVRLRRHVRQSIQVSFAAWWGASIPLALIQPEVVPLAPLFALITTPFIAVLLALGIIALVPLPPGAHDLATRLLEPLARGVIDALDRTIDLLLLAPGTPALWPPVPPESIALLLASVGALVRVRRVTREVALASILALGLACIPPRTPAVIVPRLGRGQSVIVVTDRATIAYDAGSVDRADGGARILSAELRRLGRDRFDLVVLSHPHADHVLALPHLLDRGQVARVAVGPRFKEVPLGALLLERVERYGVPIERWAAGRRWQLGGTAATGWVLHPPELLPKPLRLSVNDNSLVVRLTLREGSILLTGDLEELGCQLVSPPPRADVLLLPHHGRANRRVVEWTLPIDPQVILAASIGAPSEEVERLQRIGYPVAGTGADGTVRAVVRDGSWVLERRRERGWHSPRTWSTVLAP